MRNLFIVVAVAMALSTTSLAQGPQSMERDSWQGPIAPGSAVRIHNPFGDIRLRHGGSEGSLEAAAVLQQLATDGSKLNLEVEIGDEEAVITIVRRDVEGKIVMPAPRGDLARADLAVLVPEGFATGAETAAGLIESRGVRADIVLKTVSGTIRVAKHRGRINADSDSGVMEITLEPATTKEIQRFTSVTGSITVFTPADSDFEVELATSGTITTDFTLEIAHADNQEPDKTATSVIGRGGASLSMTSKRGDLALRRVVTADTD